MLDCNCAASSHEVRQGLEGIWKAVNDIGGMATLELEGKEQPPTKTTRVLFDHQQAILPWLFEQPKPLDDTDKSPASLAGRDAIGSRVIHRGKRLFQTVVSTALVPILPFLAEPTPSSSEVKSARSFARVTLISQDKHPLEVHVDAGDEEIWIARERVRRLNATQ